MVKISFGWCDDCGKEIIDDVDNDWSYQELRDIHVINEKGEKLCILCKVKRNREKEKEKVSK